MLLCERTYYQPLVTNDIRPLTPKPPMRPRLVWPRRGERSVAMAGGADLRVVVEAERTLGSSTLRDATGGSTLSIEKGYKRKALRCQDLGALER
ncbi:hypothetical protein E2C01_045921 [Portunus trituberculatus]|uniref:Uncharacterized protein n=1 Tax=Portunus trituberculatus TaxID=210409 RepID=A0A5B7FX23_PORTR|nr:hypothetical protein [Portunus trituberculatus]